MTTIKQIGGFKSFFDSNRDKTILCCYGGAGSGKSWAIIQDIVLSLVNSDNLHIALLRKTSPSLVRSTLNMFTEVLESMGLTGYCHIIKNPWTVKFGTNIVWGFSMDDPQKIRSMNLNIAYLEEANEFSQEDFTQVRLRLRRPNLNGINKIYLSFNPSNSYHWTADLVRHPTPEVAIHHSTYQNNPTLDDIYIQGLEQLKGNDSLIYARGEFGIAENTIYPNFEVSDKFPMLSDCTRFYGLDFGFNAPTALVEVLYHYATRTFYVKERFYETHVTNEKLVPRLHWLAEQSDPVFCDSAEPGSIQMLKDAGISAYEAEKNVKDGINYVKSCHVIIHPDSTNLLSEAGGYHYRTEKKYGLIMDEPEKINDHLMDALRYAIFTMRLSHGMPPTTKETVKIPGLPSGRPFRKERDDEATFDASTKKMVFGETKKERKRIPGL